MIRNEKVVTNNFDFFPTPVTIVNLGEQSRPLNKEILEVIFKEKQQEENRRVGSGISVFQSKFFLEDKYEIFKKLQKVFLDLSKPALARAGFGGNIEEYITCEEFWFNVCDTPYGYNIPHNHGAGDTYWAGVYYPTSGIQDGVSISEKQDLSSNVFLEATQLPKPGSLILHDPAHAVKSQVYSLRKDFKKYPYSGLSISIQPKEGTLVLFPAWLVHSVVPTEKENFTRVSIAFSFNKKK